jgi:hypothetical protein
MDAQLAALITRIEDLERRHGEAVRELQRLRDIEDIRQLKYRYFRAIDSADSTLLAGTLTEDFSCRFRSDAFDLNLSSRDAFVARMAQFASDQTAAQHQGHHPEISIEDDSHASGIWYLQDIVHQIDLGQIMAGTCFYKDRYLRTPDGWRIQSSWWDRHLEVRHATSFMPNYTGRYLKAHGRKRDRPFDPNIGKR